MSNPTIRKPTHADDDNLCVAALYHFVRFPRFEAFRAPLLSRCRDAGVRGTLILAPEGINGTVAGPDAAIADLLSFLRAQPEFSLLTHKESRAAAMPFQRMKVRVKREIVTMGVDGIDPENAAGAHVEPADWNRLISDPATLVIDARNDYEVAIGTFEGAISPETRTFREFPAWAAADPRLGKDGDRPKVAMFCTGGIRCEKATAFLRAQGFTDVFHLKGGILKYLEAVPQEKSLWRGECFVFDERVAVTHGLCRGRHTLCRACRRPLSADERSSPLFEEGVSCPHCHGLRSADDRARYRERQRQMDLAQRRGKAHLGA